MQRSSVNYPSKSRASKPAYIAVSLLLVIMFSTLGGAQNAPPSPAVPPMSPATQYLQQRLHPGGTLENFLQQMRNEFRQGDADSNGEINAVDIELHANAGAASMRAMFAMMIMRADLNDDGVVTVEELRRFFRYERRTYSMPGASNSQVEEQVEAEVKKLMAADADGDGSITYAEAMRFAKTTPEFQRGIPNFGAMAERLLTFAPEGKSSVKLADVESAASAVFALMDTDGDGKISQDEFKAFRSRPDHPDEQRRVAAQLAKQEREQKRKDTEEERTRKEAEAHAACAMPKASDAAKVVLFGAYQVEAISTATIGSQDVAVGVGNVTVEPGNDPLYVVLVTFRPTIWRFYGAVDRIERLVLTGTMTGSGTSKGTPNEKPLVGATGVAAEKITFLGQSKCINYFTETPSSQGAIAAAAVRREAGKEVSVLAARYALADVSFPSGQIQTTRDSNQGQLIIMKRSGSLKIEGDTRNVIVQTGPSNLSSELKRFSPGGVVEVDPRRVVASLPVERYEVLPQQAGLLQLVQAGKLEEKGGEFLIKDKIRFPAELTGAHSVKFLLLRGVPTPDGDPGHSEVVSEETGEILKLNGLGR